MNPMFNAVSKQKFLLRKGKLDSGFTLVELVLSIVILSISITGTLLAFQTVSVFNVDPMLTEQSLGIAKSYLSEILQKQFPTTLPCPSPPSGGRSVYQNVCDYQNLTDTGAKDQTGSAITGLENYRIQVSIDLSNAVLGSLVSGTEVVRVDIRVSHSQIPEIKLSGYKTQYS